MGEHTIFEIYLEEPDFAREECELGSGTKSISA